MILRESRFSLVDFVKKTVFYCYFMIRPEWSFLLIGFDCSGTGNDSRAQFAMVALVTFMMFFGWFGFNVGSITDGSDLGVALFSFNTLILRIIFKGGGIIRFAGIKCFP